MLNNSIKFLCLLLVFFVFSCLPNTTPAIVYQNISYGGAVVKNIKLKWDKVNPLGASELGFCGTDAQHHWINHDSDFFGPIHVEWENAQGKKLTKDLIITKEQLPSFKKRNKPNVYSSVDLYFTQDDVYLYTSDTPNIEKIREDFIKKAGLTCQEYRDREFIKKWGRRCLEKGCDEDFKPKISTKSKSPKR